MRSLTASRMRSASGIPAAILSPRAATTRSTSWGRAPIRCKPARIWAPRSGGGGVAKRRRRRAAADRDSPARRFALGRYLARLPNRFSDLTAAPTIVFTMPQGGAAIGRTPDFFVGVLRAYAESFAAGELHERQVPMAKQAMSLLCLLAGKAINDMIDEACGVAKAPVLTRAVAIKFLVNDAMDLGFDDIAGAYLALSRKTAKRQLMLLDIGPAKPAVPPNLAPYEVKVLALLAPLPEGVKGMERVIALVGGKTTRVRAAIRKLLGEGKVVRIHDGKAATYKIPVAA